MLRVASLIVLALATAAATVASRRVRTSSRATSLLATEATGLSPSPKRNEKRGHREHGYRRVRAHDGCSQSQPPHREYGPEAQPPGHQQAHQAPDEGPGRVEKLAGSPVVAAAARPQRHRH